MYQAKWYHTPLSLKAHDQTLVAPVVIPSALFVGFAALVIPKLCI